MLWLGILCAVLGITVVILLVKIVLLHRAADEIHSQFVEKLENDTNTLILLSTRDRYMCRLAEEITCSSGNFVHSAAVFSREIMN